MRISIADFGERYFYFDRSSTTQGRFNREKCQWLAAPDGPLEGFADPRCRMGTCRCAAQGGKTNTGMLAAMWAMSEDPGPFMWTLPAADEAKTFAQTRLRDVIERCAPVSRLLPKGRYDVKDLEINFSTAPLLLVGAGSGSKVSGKPVRWLFVDEEKNYKPGMLPRAMMRIRSKWDAKIWRMSTSLHADDSIDQAFKEGDQRHWHVTCPNCGKEDYLRWEHLKFEHEDLRVWDIRYECPGACGHSWKDNPADRRFLGSKGKWVKHNPLAPPGDWSWSWNAMLPEWVVWYDLVLEYLKAKRSWKIGDHQPLITFFNETANEPWDEDLVASNTKIELTDTYSVKDYENGEKVDGEIVRFATIDRGLDHEWLCIRAWRNDGSSRLLYYEQQPSFQKRDEAIRKYGVPANNVFLDYGYEQDKVFAECANKGYLGIRGLSAAESFRHPMRNRQGLVSGYEEKPYSRIVMKDAGKGLPNARAIDIAPQRMKDITASLRAGEGPKWEVASDINRYYLNQLVREQKELGRNPKTGSEELRWKDSVKNNHAWDCETYQTAAAMAFGAYRP